MFEIGQPVKTKKSISLLYARHDDEYSIWVKFEPGTVMTYIAGDRAHNDDYYLCYFLADCKKYLISWSSEEFMKNFELVNCDA